MDIKKFGEEMNIRGQIKGLLEAEIHLQAMRVQLEKQLNKRLGDENN